MAGTSELVCVDPVDNATACRQPEEFAAVHRDHFPRVFNFIASRLRDHDLAQELTADVFARACERCGRLRDRSAVTSWLFGKHHRPVRAHHGHGDRGYSEEHLEAC